MSLKTPLVLIARGAGVLLLVIGLWVSWLVSSGIHGFARSVERPLDGPIVGDILIYATTMLVFGLIALLFWLLADIIERLEKDRQERSKPTTIGLSASRQALQVPTNPQVVAGNADSYAVKGSPFDPKRFDEERRQRSLR